MIRHEQSLRARSKDVADMSVEIRSLFHLAKIRGGRENPGEIPESPSLSFPRR